MRRCRRARGCRGRRPREDRRDLLAHLSESADADEALADVRGAHLSEAAERLSRLLALMIRDVEHRDASALRQRIAQIPIQPPHQS